METLEKMVMLGSVAAFIVIGFLIGYYTAIIKGVIG